MLTELVLTHPCGKVIVWSAGGYFKCRGRRCRSSTTPAAISHCPTCGEWFGAPFVRIEENSRPARLPPRQVRVSTN